MHGNQRQTDLAYVAGILDADGCFMISKHNRKTPAERKFFNVDKRTPTFLPCVKICMIEEEAVKFIKEALKFGTYHIDRARKDRINSKPIFHWYLRGANSVLPFLNEVVPFLKVKKERAKFLAEFCKKVSTKNNGYRGVSEDELNYREDSYKKMREFNGNKVAATTESLRPERVCDS